MSALHRFKNYTQKGWPPNFALLIEIERDHKAGIAGPATLQDWTKRHGGKSSCPLGIAATATLLAIIGAPPGASCGHALAIDLSQSLLTSGTSALLPPSRELSIGPTGMLRYLSLSGPRL